MKKIIKEGTPVENTAYGTGYTPSRSSGAFQQSNLQQSGNYQQPNLQQSGNYQQGNLQQSGNYQQSNFQQSTNPVVTMETLEKPTITHETIFPSEKIEVQPIVHREREQLEYHEVIQPLHEKDVVPTVVKYATLPNQVKPDVRESDAQFQTKYQELASRYHAEVSTQPVAREFINKAPIVEERISRRIVEEIQPVLYKETIAPVLIEETQPIYERVIEAPTITEEIRQPLQLGTKMLPECQNRALTDSQNRSLVDSQGFQKETYVTKEYYPAQMEKVERSVVTETKRKV